MERDFRKGDPQELNPGAGIAGLLEGGKSGGCRERERERETGSLDHASLELFLLPRSREAPEMTLHQERGKGGSEGALK